MVTTNINPHTTETSEKIMIAAKDISGIQKIENIMIPKRNSNNKNAKSKAYVFE